MSARGGARRALAGIALGVLLAAGGAAAAPPTELDRLLLEPRPAPALRARLAAHARAIDATDRYQAAQAWQVAGRSALRSGLPDSAVAALERAVALRGSADDVAALADARLARGGQGDAAAARAAAGAALAGTEVALERAMLSERLAAAFEALGATDSALAVWRTLAAPPPTEPFWARRVALALAGSPVAAERALALERLATLVVDSRGHDREALRTLAALPGAPDRARLERALAARAERADDDEVRALAALGARPVRFPAADGFTLAGAALAPAGRGRPAAIVLVAPGEPLTVADSLAVALARAGRAVLLLHPRGAGGSVGDAWPGPWAVAGREEAWTSAGAGDVAAAVRALGAATGCDTTRVLVAAGGAAVAPATDAAARDRRVTALVLASPVADEPDRAPLLARVAASGAAVFVQLAPEDFFSAYGFADALFRAGLARHSRESESQVAGTGLGQWRGDAAARERLTRWLAEPLPRAPRAPRPAARRPG